MVEAKSQLPSEIGLDLYHNAELTKLNENLTLPILRKIYIFYIMKLKKIMYKMA